MARFLKASGTLKQFIAEIVGDGNLAEEGKEEVADDLRASNRSRTSTNTAGGNRQS